MRTDPILRLVFAVLFGVMSVLPVPLRAFALPVSIQNAHATPAADVTLHAGGHHGHGAGGHYHGAYLADVLLPADETSVPSPAEDALLCHSASCCMAYTQSLPCAQAAILLLLGQLAVPPAQIIVAVKPDPVVPPPRLPA